MILNESTAGKAVKEASTESESVIIRTYELKNKYSFVFCLNTNFIIIAFFKLSMCWPKLLRHFCKTENSIRKYGYYINCHKRFIIILTVAVGTVMLEHSLAVANTYLNIEPSKYLEHNRTRLEQYFREEFPFIFDYVAYNVVLGFTIFTCR
ncbi:uncharacterized protein LOC114332455 [Diabrotica virgifera virgifera]|uniref:Uncharacterized protein n=1 Tax=Diabrotica virgifera virgifera TaxID=50390 RepID=A0ABM5L0V4_DIAVI|nr:uncharacterized protein LOC114332455 [Diabrotica virgifera virgifera]